MQDVAEPQRTEQALPFSLLRELSGLALRVERVNDGVPIREPHHNTLRTRDVAITARTRGPFTGVTAAPARHRPCGQRTSGHFVRPAEAAMAPCSVGPQVSDVP